MSAGALRAGCFARLEGMCQQQQLNGEFCRVLRPAENGRWIVSTSSGDKSIKSENLRVAAVQLPGFMSRSICAGTIATVLLVADLVRSSGRSVVAATLTPIAAVLWLLATLSCCYRLHKPFLEAGVWVPAISEMVVTDTGRRVYQYGFSLVGLLFGCTMKLYDVLLMPQVLASEGSEVTSVSHSIALGYLAAAGVVLQGLLTLESQLSWRSLLHFGGAIMFVMGTMHHATLSNALLASVKDTPLVVGSLKAQWAMVVRRFCSEYGPVALMVLPLGHQVVRRVSPQKGEAGAGTTGIQNAMGMAQWALVLNFAVFFSSYAGDFWTVTTAGA